MAYVMGQSVYINDRGLTGEKFKKMFAVMEQWSHAGTSFLFIFVMPMIIFMFYNIFFLHASFTCIYFANILLHNIVYNVLSDNKNCCCVFKKQIAVNP